jgi:hypothetical protein
VGNLVVLPDDYVKKSVINLGYECRVEGDENEQQVP